jgi:hypothetical protein
MTIFLLFSFLFAIIIVASSVLYLYLRQEQDKFISKNEYSEKWKFSSTVFPEVSLNIAILGWFFVFLSFFLPYSRNNVYITIGLAYLSWIAAIIVGYSRPKYIKKEIIGIFTAFVSLIIISFTILLYYFYLATIMGGLDCLENCW